MPYLPDSPVLALELRNIDSLSAEAEKTRTSDLRRKCFLSGVTTPAISGAEASRTR